VKFAHDQMQLPFWAFTGLFFYRALTRGRLLDWVLSGVFLAGAFWSKYAAFALAATLGLFLLFDPVARRAWRTPGPYVMATAFAIVIAPNAWWLVANDFLPFTYVDQRAVGATRWYQYFSYPLLWVTNNAFALLPALGLLALLFGRDIKWRPVPDDKAAFNLRYVTTLALGPFVVTTLVAAALGRLAVSLWGYPLWSFAPLALLLWVAPVRDPQRLRLFAGGFIALFVFLPLIYAAYELGEPFVHDRPKATQFPGTLLAETVTRQWRERTGMPLRYVGGAALTVTVDGVERLVPGAGEFAANNVAVYSPDHPHVVVHGDPRLSPWINRDDLKRHGLMLLWSAGTADFPQNLRAAYPQAQQQPSLVLPRQTLYPRSPMVIHYAIVPPQP
jgi:hypothetical protein